MSMQNQSVNAIRMLGVDMVNQANSGHPGIVLGAAPTMYALFSKHLSYNPEKPDWVNRDRFVLSAGHGSAMIYATLHLAGYDLPMEEVKNFRQWGSKTPGHPEYAHTPGIEATTGPLGQGISMAVGMAIGEKYLAATLNKDGKAVMDHYTYVLCGDGDLQEGVALESLSIAGHMGLEKLILLHDSNDIQLDGPVCGATSDDIAAKMKSMGWNYILVEDGNNADAVSAAIDAAKENKGCPSFIEVKTTIGFGSPSAGSSSTHGSPLGSDNTKVLRENLGWDLEPFVIPDDVYADFKASNQEKGVEACKSWEALAEEYIKENAEEGKVLKALMEGKNVDMDYEEIFAQYEPAASVATRASSGEMLTMLQKANPLMIGGSADLASSTKVKGIGGDFCIENPTGRNINFGVREHAMAAVCNGLVLQGLKAFAGGFFIFSDYMKPAMRLSALMGIGTIYAFTHDSVAVGEDGPTHEPIEQMAGLRAMPNMDVIRPADANEVKAAWQLALASEKTPTSLLLTRQNVPTLEGVTFEGVEKGAYVLSPEKKETQAVLIATGSEVSLALDAQKELWENGIDTRVVSMPSMFRFKKQDEAYQQEVLAKPAKRISVEMGSSFGWAEFVGCKGKCLAIDTFGASAPGGEVIKNFGFTVENLVNMVKELVD